jgi:hypothetical protein
MALRSAEIEQEFLKENQRHEQLQAALAQCAAHLSELRGQHQEALLWEAKDKPAEAKPTEAEPNA